MFQLALRIWRYSFALYERWKGYKNLVLGAKIVFVLALLILLYFDLNSRKNLPEIWQEFLYHLSGANWFWLIAVLVLMPFNWMAESEKWLQFVRRHQVMPRRTALMAVLAGVSVSLFTPNRVGEFGGRILFVRPEGRWIAAIANLVGNFAQYMVLLATGVAGAIYVMCRFEVIDQRLGWLLVAGGTIGLAGMAWWYFHIEGVIAFVRKLPVLKPLQFIWNYLNLGILREFTRNELIDIIRWAAIRYSIYAFQYFCLLHFFSIHVDVLGGFSGIAALFLLQTSIPMPPVTGLVARGNLAVLLWSQFGANEISSLAATFTLWVINLIIPALIGTFAIVYVRIENTSATDHANTEQEKVVPVPADPVAEL